MRRRSRCSDDANAEAEEVQPWHLLMQQHHVTSMDHSHVGVQFLMAAVLEPRRFFASHIQGPFKRRRCKTPRQQARKPNNSCRDPVRIRRCSDDTARR